MSSDTNEVPVSAAADLMNENRGSRKFEPNRMGSTHARARLIPFILLGIILAWGGYLRFQGLESRQPRISDEADYLMEAQWVDSLIHTVLDSLATFREERRTGEDLWKQKEQLDRIEASIQGQSPSLARPGHVLLIALTMQFGMDPVLAGAWESAFFGILTVFLLFFFARHLYGTWTGLLSSFLLAISAYHVWYSRTGFSEADATFFLLLTVYLYLLSTEKDRGILYGLTGLSAGIGFIVHHRFGLFLCLICVLEFFRFFRMRSDKTSGKWKTQFLTLLFFFSLPALSIEILYHLAMIAFQLLGRPLPCPTYFSQLLFVFGYIRINNLIPYAHYFTWSNFLTFPYLFWYMDGPLLCLLLVGGIAALCVRRGRSERVLALFFLFPLFFYSYKNANARFACSAIPFAAVSVALFLKILVDGARERERIPPGVARLAIVCLLTVQAGISFAKIHEHDGLSADWRSVMTHLQRTGDVKNISVYPHMSRLYLGADVTTKPPDTQDGLKELFEQGFTSLILTEFLEYYAERFDFPEMNGRFPAIQSLLASRLVAKRVDQELEPSIQVPCDFCISPLNILEINLNFKKSLAFMRKGRENGYDTIKVYDLKAFFPHDGKQGPSDKGFASVDRSGG